MPTQPLISGGSARIIFENNRGLSPTVIAVDGDPLRDVRVLERVAVVIKGGWS